MFKEYYQAVCYCILNDIKRYSIDGDPSIGWFIRKKSKKLKIKDIPDYWRKK